MDFTVCVDECCCDDNAVERNAPPNLPSNMLLSLYLSETEPRSNLKGHLAGQAFHQILFCYGMIAYEPFFVNDLEDTVG